MHAIATAVLAGDVDAALEQGLLDVDAPCAGCSEACRAQVTAVRDERRFALAARARFQARAARLQRRADARAAARNPTLAAAPATGRPPLPPAAAAALARAKARAAERKP